MSSLENYNDHGVSDRNPIVLYSIFHRVQITAEQKGCCSSATNFNTRNTANQESSLHATKLDEEIYGNYGGNLKPTNRRHKRNTDDYNPF